ncbi:MAG: hypothetical protein KC736_03080 [Candidatus Moranbacteria bacterium]|nr:hypothetical protein [Candidatus Moranbacteria bacterium]
MGVLFNRKTSGGGIVNKKYVPNKGIPDAPADLRSLAKDLGVSNYRQVKHVSGLLSRVKHGVSRQTFTKELQKLVDAGHLSEDLAVDVAQKAGIPHKEAQRRINDISEHREAQKLAGHSQSGDDKMVSQSESRRGVVHHLDDRRGFWKSEQVRTDKTKNVSDDSASVNKRSKLDSDLDRFRRKVV